MPVSRQTNSPIGLTAYQILLPLGAEVNQSLLQRHDFSSSPHLLLTAKSAAFLQEKLVRISKEEHRSF